MTAQNRFRDFGVGNGRSTAWVSLCETDWGYIIRSDTDLANRAALIERVCAITGIAFLAVALGQWMIPAVNAAVALPAPERIASTMGLTIPALLFLWISARGMTREVQVDVDQRCVRLAVCNRNGRSRVLRAFAFERIGSAFIKRGGPGESSRLFLRLEGSGKPAMHVASGREATLRVLHQRLSQELHPAPARRGTDQCKPAMRASFPGGATA